MNGKIVCHISYHLPFDDRIYWKELLSLQEAGYTSVHLCVSGRDEEYITGEGIRIIEIGRKKYYRNVWLNRAAQLLFRRKGIQTVLLEKAAALKAAIYHYHDLQVNAIAKKLKNLPQQPKVIYDVHEVYWSVVKEQRKKGLLSYIKSRLVSIVYKWWELKQASYCDYIIATDDFTLRYFQKHLPGIPKSIVYNYSYFLPQLPLEGTKKYHFIYTGLMSESRGILDALKGIKLLKEQFAHVRLLLIGTFETAAFEEVVNAYIHLHGLQQNIEIHPQIPFQQISDFYNSSLIGLGLFHHTPKYSTFIPIKLFEYMAFGLPVIFTAHGPSGTIINETNCGLLVEPKNIKAIAEAMKTLLTDTTLYTTHNFNGRQAVKDTYNWNIEKEKLLHIYKMVLG